MIFFSALASGEPQLNAKPTAAAAAIMLNRFIIFILAVDFIYILAFMWTAYAQLKYVNTYGLRC
jgi:hypothetical protein